MRQALGGMAAFAAVACLLGVVGGRFAAVEPTLPPSSEPRPAPRVDVPGRAGARIVLPDGQNRTVRSVLNITRPMRYGGFVWDEHGVPAGPVWVRIDLATQILSVFRAGHEIGTAVILYGADKKPTPTGVFPVLARMKDHRSSLYDAEMPYSLQLTTDGVAIHGSNVRYGAATHGCIGVPLAFGAKLFAAIHRGDEVAIFPGQVAAAS